MIKALLAAARVASATELGLIGLAIVIVSGFLWLVWAWDRALRLRVAALGLIGLVLFIAATYAALPPKPASTDASVILIDKSSDYANGLPAGIFDQASTRHMMRDRVGGPMWAPAGNPPYGVGWRIGIIEPARYQLEVRYSAETPHRAEVRVDEIAVFTGLTQITADRWKPRWFREGTVDLHAGINRLAFFSESTPLPWIAAVRLTRLAPSSRP